MRTHTVRLFLCCFLCIAGCSPLEKNLPTEPSAALKEIINKIDQKVFAELSQHLQYKLIRRTLWIALPINKTLFVLSRSDGKSKKNAFDYRVTGKYLGDDNNLNFGYTITEGAPYDPQVRFAPTDEEEKIFTFLYRHALYEFVQQDTSHLELDFVCIDIIDTVNKVGLSYRFNIDDLKKIIFGMVRGIEVNIRMQQEFFYVTDTDVQKNTFLDRKEELTWGDFIANQIQTRVAYSLKDNDAFQNESNVESIENTISQTIVNATKETLQNYPFRNVNKLYIKNIALTKDGPATPKIFYNYELVGTDSTTATPK